MPGRFLEVGRERSRPLRDWLEQFADRILVYAYGDWLKRCGNLTRLCNRGGFYYMGEEDRTAGFAEILSENAKRDVVSTSKPPTT